MSSKSHKTSNPVKQTMTLTNTISNSLPKTSIATSGPKKTSVNNPIGSLVLKALSKTPAYVPGPKITYVDYRKIREERENE